MAYQGGPVEGHGGDVALAALRAAGVEELFTLSGGHVFPVYDAAVREKVRIVDVRHEQTAAFAAEGTAKLTRRPGLAVVTAGPGVTNSVSAVTSAHFTGVPLVVLGGRAPTVNWGRGGLQELDHVPLLAPVTKAAATAGSGDAIGPTLLDGRPDRADPAPRPGLRRRPDGRAVLARVGPDRAARAGGRRRTRPGGGRSRRPAGRRRRAAGLRGRRRRLHRPCRGRRSPGPRPALRVPVFANGMGRGCLPADDPLAFSRVRGLLRKEADLVVVVGTPLDFRLAFGDFGAAEVVHVADAADGVARHRPLAPPAPPATWPRSSTGSPGGRASAPTTRPGCERLRAAEDAARAADAEALGGTGDPIRPPAVYGALRSRLARDAVVVGDGGDFVSYAGKYVDSYQPGCWLDPGPYGCLGTGLGYAMAARIARPASQVVLLLGDGAAGFSLMDVDTLVRHRLPVVIVVGNNAGWGLEKHPMRAIYGYDVAAELRPETRYDEVVRALGGAGETVRRSAQLGPALDRAFAADVPYLVNVLTDPADAYPRTSVLA